MRPAAAVFSPAFAPNSMTCGLMGRGGSKPALAWAALVAALVGGLVFRIMMWIVGSGFYGFFG